MQGTNWTGNVAPGSSDDASISVGGGTTINLPSGGISVNSLTQSGGSLVLSSGTINTAAGLTLHGVNFTDSGAIIGAGTATFDSSVLHLHASTVANPSPFVFAGASTLDGTFLAGQGVRVEGGLNGTATLTLASGSANLSTIVLQSLSGNGYPSNLAVATGSTFTNAGTIQVNVSVSSSSLTGNFTNQGTVNVVAGANLTYAGPTAATFTQASGTLTASGTFDCTSGILRVQGGTVTGQVQADGCQLQLDSTISTPTTVYAAAATTLVSNDSAMARVWVEGGLNGQATLTLAAGSANKGTILLQSLTANGYRSNLAVATGSSFTNAGTIQVGVSLSASYLTGNFTNGNSNNQGSLTVLAGANLTYAGPAGATFTQAGGTLAAPGLFDAILGTLLVQGGTVSGQVQADGCLLQMASTISTPTTVYAAAATTLLSNDSAMARVWVEGGLNGQATLTLAANSANAGTILLQSLTANGYRSNLAVATGSSFTNAGTIQVGVSLSASYLTGNFTNGNSNNQGSLTVLAGANLTYAGPAGATFTQASGTLAAPGLFDATLGTLLVQGGTVSGQVEADGCLLQMASTISTPMTVFAIAATTLISNDSTMGTVRVEGGLNGSATLTLAANSANAGTILLQSASGSGYTSNLAVATGSSFTNTGTIQVGVSLNPSYLTGNFTNQGSITVFAGATFLYAGPSGATFTQAGGSLSANGTFDCTTGTLLVQGGTVSGQVQADGCQLKMASTISTPTTVYAAAATTLVSNDSAMARVWVEGGLNGHATLTLASGSANAGTILLQSLTANGYRSSLAVATGSSFTNTGTIQVGVSLSPSVLTGNFTNQGSITVYAGANLNDAGPAGATFTQASGTLSANGTFDATLGTLLVQGGAVSGLVQADGCLLKMDASISTPTTVYAAAATTLLSNDSAMARVWVEGGLNGHATLTLAANSANVGTILLQSLSGNGYTSNLAVATGSTFVNTGTIQVGVSLAASSLTGNLTNLGTINIAGASLTLGSSGTNLVNETAGVINATGTLGDTTGSFTNKGTLGLGTGAAGTLTITGGYTQTSSGHLRIELGGTTAGTLFDQLVVRGQAALDGSLDVSLINGFLPINGNSFRVLTYASSSGSFATYTGVNLPNGLILTPSQTSTFLTLNASPPPQADLAVSVVAQPTVVTLGNSVTYTVTVTNNGPNIGSGVTLLDTLPSGVTVNSITPSVGSYTISGGVVTVNFGSLLVGASDTLTILVTPGAIGAYPDQASVSGSLLDPNLLNNAGSASANVVAPQADLSVGVVASPGVAFLGGTVTYTVTVNNLGPNVASGVVLTDTLPSGVTVNSITASAGVYSTSGSVITLNVGTVSVGSPVTLTVVVTPGATGTFVDSASVASSSPADPNPANNTNSGTAMVIPPPSADLYVGVVANPGQVTLGSSLTYTVTVNNLGPNVASSVVLTDTLPSGVTVNSIRASAGITSTSGGVVTLNVGSVSVNSPVTLTIVVTPGAIGTFLDSASVLASSPADPNTGNNTASASATVGLPPQADLSVGVVASPVQQLLGGTVTYTVTVNNLGPYVASGVVLTDNLPSGVTVNSITASAGTPSTSGGVVTLGLSSMAVGSPVTLTIVVTSTSPGTFVDSASVTSSSPADPNPSNNIASGSATFVPSADLSVAISGPPSVTTNGSLTFTATVTNHGPSASAGSTLSDTLTLPAGTTLVSEAVSQGSVSLAGNVVTARFGTIAAGSTSTLTIVVTATQSGTFVDSANVTASTADPVPGNNSASSSFTVRGLASVALTTSVASSSLRQPVTLTALVSVPAGFVRPTRTVTFFDGTTALGIAQVNNAGSASLVVSTLGLGTHSLTAAYSGDANYAATTSAPDPFYVGDGQKSDFDGDGKADLGVYGRDPATGRYDFRVRTSSSNFTTTVTFDNHGFGFGNAQSIPVAADYFGDGRSSYALWYPNGQGASVQGSMTFIAISPVTGRVVTANFGSTADLPVIGDVDGDGKADFGVYGYDPRYGYRFDFLLSSRSFDVARPYLFNNGSGFGNAQSIPVVADFDGSGRAGFGLYVPSTTGSFFVYASSSSGFSFTRTIGGPSDIPSAIEYDGDGKADLALYGPDPANRNRYRYTVLTSSTTYDVTRTVTFDNSGNGYGNSTSTPVIADYEGNGKADFALYIPDAKGGMEYLYQTSQTGAAVVVDFATVTDIPLTAPTYLIAKKVR